MAKEISEKTAAKEIERQGLAALLAYNEFIPEVMAVFKPEYFNSDSQKKIPVHSTIYSLIVAVYQEKQSVDQTMLIIKLDQLGLKDYNGLDMAAYVKTLYNIPVNKEFVLDYFREVYKMYTCRRAYTSLGKAQTYIISNLEKPLREILDEVQTIVTDCLAANIDERIKLTDIYEELAPFLSERAEQKEKLRLLTGFPVFDDWYGGIYLKGVYVFSAPAKVGKSTFLNYLAYQMVNIPENKLKVLILDTELETEFAMSRAASALTGENEFEFLEGSFAKNPRIAKKTNEALASIHHLKGKVTHSYVGNISIDDILAISRRWYVNNVKPGESALVVYDYIKLSGGSAAVNDHWKEYQEIGEKTDKLKKFISSLPRAALCTSVQTNAAKEVAMSKQILWFANNVYILDRKTLDEIQTDGANYGTHKLIEIVTRNQGRGAHGAHNYFKVQNPDGRTTNMQNFLHFDFSNFAVKECGDHESCISSKENLQAEKGPVNNIDF